MKPRALETSLAWFTLGALTIYFPVETWASMPDVWMNPYYYVDFVAMMLLFWGAMHSLRARPHAAPGVLCAGFAWASANGWRATSWRVEEVAQGGDLRHGAGELWTVGIGTALSVVCLAITLLLVSKADRGVKQHDSAPAQRV